jgi:hypothetical protein
MLLMLLVLLPALMLLLAPVSSGGSDDSAAPKDGIGLPALALLFSLTSTSGDMGICTAPGLGKGTCACSPSAPGVPIGDVGALAARWWPLTPSPAGGASQTPIRLGTMLCGGNGMLLLLLLPFRLLFSGLPLLSSSTGDDTVRIIGGATGLGLVIVAEPLLL